MRLKRQRIAVSRFVVARFEEPPPPLSPFFVLPAVNAASTEIDVLELRIGVPNDPRCQFVCSNQQRRLIESLLYCDFEQLMICYGYRLALLCSLPSTVRRSSVLRGPNRTVWEV